MPDISNLLPPGAYVVFPWPADAADLTWADLREVVALGQHYPDSADVEWDWTDHHVSHGQVANPSGIIIRSADDVEAS